MAIGDVTQGDQYGVLRSTSEAPPAHYILNIQQFSSLTKHNVERYESGQFEAGGYKWYFFCQTYIPVRGTEVGGSPKWQQDKKVGEFLSVYLAMAEPSSLPPGWEVYATFRIFLLDQNNDNYLKLEDIHLHVTYNQTRCSNMHLDAISRGRRFHQMRTEWGFDRFIDLKEFGDSSNGYLQGDDCVFGAEVFVCKERSKGKTECLSMVKDAVAYKHTWKISSYTKIMNTECETSNILNAGDHKWKIKLYPNGKGSIGNYITLNLALADPTNLPPGTKILAEFTLRMLDQLDTRHYFGKASYWFSASKTEWGWKRFITHGTFFQNNRGLLFKDVCSIEAEIAIHGEATVVG
ncbi:hypothetical protein OSB04_029590 [Centaurea solstitialis]|uniref:MATH domain-containing protein n=1 Tax=Centaurea solstitialis TaxID=347529 RepID=A0AA38VSE2_9ASTR|nr:hypothetical protein OSB04_029590 [Centaurea solstitialis]